MHAPAARPAPARRGMGQTARKVAGYFFYLPLLILFWFIFYQNVPDTLHGVTIKPISTLGAIDRTVKLAMLAIGVGVFASRWAHARVLLQNINPGLAAMMLLIPLSAAWSIDSGATLLRYTTLLSLVMLCLAIPLAGWERRRLQQVVVPPMMAILVISLMLGAVSPDLVKEIGTDLSLNNAWHGITFQKNQFGVTSSIAAILCVHRWLAPEKHSFWTLAGIGVALLCLALSRSSTSLMATMLVCTFMFLMLKISLVKQRFSTLVVVGIFSLILVYALAVQNLIPGVGKLLAPVMHLTGKDMTFSARSIIWDVIKQHSAAAPWLGTGYGAYWTEESPSSPSYIFLSVMSFWPSSSHNGYLEIMNDLGRVGLVCLLAFLIFYVRQALQLMKYDRAQAVLYLGLLFQQMIDNLSESEWFSRTSTCTILLLACTCLSRAVAEQRLNPAAVPVPRRSGR